MKINHAEIMRQAAEMEISAHIIIKRKLNYRKAESLDGLCKFCKSLNKETIKDGKAQCETIGEGFDVYSEIDLRYTCNAYKK